MGTVWSFEEALEGFIRNGEIFKGNELRVIYNSY